MISEIYESKYGYCAETISYEGRGYYKVRFLDGTGITEIYRKDKLSSGRFRNPFEKTVFGVGYLGKKQDKEKKVDNYKKIYYVWSKMISRCYNIKDAVYPYYGAKGHCVCSEWHSFYRFLSWAIVNGYRVDYELDKDLLNKSQMKIYSPETCVFLPKRINSALAHHEFKGYNQGNKIRIKIWSPEYNKRVLLGVFDSEASARSAVKSAKERNVKHFAQLYKDEISDKAYEALLVWEAYGTALEWIEEQKGE